MATGFNHFPQIAERIKPFCQRVVKETANQVQGWAKSEAPYKTGYLQGNIYKSDWESSDYGSGGIAGAPGSYLLPEVKPSNDTSAIVGAAANYSGYLEFGTRYMPAQPYFYKAVELARPFFEGELGKLEAELAASV